VSTWVDNPSAGSGIGTMCGRPPSGRGTAGDAPRRGTRTGPDRMRDEQVRTCSSRAAADSAARSPSIWSQTVLRAVSQSSMEIAPVTTPLFARPADSNRSCPRSSRPPPGRDRGGWRPVATPLPAGTPQVGAVPVAVAISRRPRHLLMVVLAVPARHPYRSRGCTALCAAAGWVPSRRLDEGALGVWSTVPAGCRDREYPGLWSR
jgi:hypothetical protein